MNLAIYSLLLTFLIYYFYKFISSYFVYLWVIIFIVLWLLSNQKKNLKKKLNFGGI